MKTEQEPLNLVVYAPNSWDGPWMNRQQLLSRLGKKGSRIIYSTGLWSKGQLSLKNIINNLFGGFIKQDFTITDVRPGLLWRWPSLLWYDRQVVKFNNYRLLRKLGSIQSETIYYVFHPAFYEYVPISGKRGLVYHIYDLYHLSPGWNSKLEAFQQKLLMEADLVIASSEQIAKEVKNIVPRDVIVLENGADVEYFKNTADEYVNPPHDIVGIPSPRIGYTGAINKKVDFPTILLLAERHSKWQFVFVGGVGELDELTRHAYEKCLRMCNVHFLGFKDKKLLPIYMGEMDANIMCYRVDRSSWAIAIYPLKLHEYLAVGKPVIGSNLPSLAKFSHVVHIAKDVNGWEKAILSALDESESGDKKALFRSVAEQNSWDLRVDVLQGLLGKTFTSMD